MTFDIALAGLVSLALGAYLIYAIIHPEKF